MKRAAFVYVMLFALAFALNMYKAEAEVAEVHSLKGTVEAVVSNDLFTVKLIDAEMLQIVNFNTDERTTFENVDSVQHLKQGDVVSVQFSKDDNQNIAQHINRVGSIQVIDASQSS